MKLFKGLRIALRLLFHPIATYGLFRDLNIADGWFRDRDRYGWDWVTGNNMWSVRTPVKEAARIYEAE